MDKSLELFRLRGISIRLHYTFPIILVLVAIQFGIITGFSGIGIVIGVVITILLFVMVLLHEIGHSLAAQHFEIEVKEIVLLPIGGMAKLIKNPEEPREEIVIASAGPVVNLGLAALFFGLGWIIALSSGLVLKLSFRYDFLNLDPLNIIGYLVVANLILAIFNLIPAFPLDGGRILRALLAIKLEYESATRLAAVLGQMIASMLAVWSFSQGAFLITLIAGIIFLMAREEEKASGFQDQIEKVTVEEIVTNDYGALESYSTLRDAVRLVMETRQKSIPVIEHNYYLGVLTQKRLVKGLEAEEFYQLVVKFIRTDIDTANPNDRVVDIQERLSANDVEILPVVDNGRYLGVVTLRDINRVFSLKFKNDHAIQEVG